MFKILSVKDDEYQIRNKETKEIITLTTQQVCSFIKKNSNDLKTDFVLEILNNSTNADSYKDILNVSLQVFDLQEKKLFNFVKKNSNRFDLEMFTKLVRNLSDSLKIKLYKQNRESLDLAFQAEIVRKVENDKIKLDFLKQNQGTLDLDSYVRIMQGLKKDKNKLNFLRQNKGLLDESAQVKIVKTLNKDRLILNYLEQNPNLSDSSKKELFTNLSDKCIFKIFNKNKFEVQNHISVNDLLLNYPYNTKEGLVLINKHLEKVSIKILDKVASVEKGLSFEKIINIFERTECKINLDKIIDLLDRNQHRLNVEQITFLVNNCSPKKQLKYYKKFASKLDDTNKQRLALTLKETKQNKSKVDKILKENGVDSETKLLAEKILKNLGFSAFINPNTTLLLLNDDLHTFNEDSIYQLCKYFAYTDTMPDVSKVINNQELFEKFQAFRKDNIPQNMLDIINIQNTLTEFNKYNNLIEGCLKREVTEQENSILVSVLKDKNIEITNKADLQNYPAQRSEYVDKLIEKDSNSAIIYLLTGMELREFRKKEALFFKDEQLSITLNDFSEELQEDIKLMQLSKEIIKFVQNEPAEIKNEILQVLKKDLEQEFTPQGSYVASLRNVFPEFETSVRALYGKELQESLTNTQMPEIQKSRGVDIIKLKGENFKLLVHGLNAYGIGKNVYVNKDVGQSYICTSLISNTQLGRAEASIYYGFSNISSRSLALEGPEDIYSDADENSLNISSFKKNTKFLKSDQLLKETKKEKYNEIVLFRDQTDEYGNVQSLMPEYIVAFNKITRRDRKEAQRLNIPIVLVDEKTYNKQMEESKKEEIQKDFKEEAMELPNQENVQEEKDSKDISDLREKMMTIIKDSKNNCSAVQQEAIVAQIQKEFKSSKEHDINQEEIHNV